ncbi:MAG: hypothetical protein J7K36_06480 [Archaeoglobaceae archaeon]|nr:hypothetical protein [Archaeoglobaceae archaeon]
MIERKNLAEALLINEKVRKKSAIDLTKIIRAWRDSRYGEDSRCASLL